MDFQFFLTSILLGVGLSMDAFSVSLANGLNDCNMSRKRQVFIAGTFAFFQALMPLLGYIAVHTLVKYFNTFQSFTPWIALALLGYIGTKMIIEGVQGKNEDTKATALTLTTLIVQGIATSIDALSVGFTIADYKLIEAVISALIIAVVTFIICIFGVSIGKKFGTKLSGKANVFGGIILICIGIEIFITGII